MTLTEALGLEIRGTAETQGLTITELAKNSGTHRVTLYRYLDGSRSIPIGTLDRIAQVLNLRGSDLLARAERRRTQ